MKIPKLEFGLRDSLIAIATIIFVLFTVYYYSIGTAIHQGQTDGPAMAGFALLIGALLCLFIASQAIAKTAKQHNLQKTIVLGAVWTAGLFFALIMLIRAASVVGYGLAPPSGGYTDFWSGLFQEQLFGCTDQLLFNIAPWFCGDALRSIADGLIYGAVIFGASKLVLGALGKPKTTPKTEKKKPKRKTKGKRG